MTNLLSPSPAFCSFFRTYQLLERHNTVTLLVSPMRYSLDQKLTVISLGLEVG